MSETNVPGIASELILEIDKWSTPLRRAQADTVSIGKAIDTNLTKAGAAATSAMGSLGGELATVTRAMHDNLAVGM